MSARHVRVLLGLGCVLCTATAAAKPAPPPDEVLDDQVYVPVDPPPPPPPPDDGAGAGGGLVVAVDAEAVMVQPPPPPPPPYEPPYVEPTPLPLPIAEEAVPGSSVFAVISAVEGRLSGDRDAFAHGGTVSVGFVERRGDFPAGFDLNATFLPGDRASAYNLSWRLIASAKIGRRKLVPFIAIGLAAGASRVVDDDGGDDADKMSDTSYGLALGPAAGAGLHGFLGRQWYWRASAGFQGAGVGALTLDAGIGMVLD